MGLLTDFFVANEDQLALLNPEEFPADRFPAFQAKGVDTVKVDLIYSVLAGRSFSEVVNSGVVVGEPSEDGPWVFRLPSDLTTLLAGVTPGQVAELASKLLPMQEFDSWNVADISYVLQNLITLAQTAKASSSHLYHSVCL